jgi:hypothetical protein
MRRMHQGAAVKKQLPGLDQDIEDYFAMQERKTAKGKIVPPAPPQPPAPEPPPTEDLDITVEEKPGEFGPETITAKINGFWDKER